jgi:multidrug efflux pump subunit AcrA (membrane-fusion protein)
LRVPSNTILFRANGLEVATVGPDNVIKMKPVNQGRDFGKTVEILTGLAPGDHVVVNPPDSINDGVHVRIAPPPPANPADQSSGHAAP